MPARQTPSRSIHRPRRALRARAAFSLVELLTVVGIIALLIGILLPTMSSARNEARRSTSKAFLGSCERGLEMFHTYFGQYPDSSRRRDPVIYPDDGNTAPTLSGAHWLTRALVGHDGDGVDYNAKSVNDPPRSLQWAQLNKASNGLYAKRRGLLVENAVFRKDNEIGLNFPASDSPLLPNRPVFLDNFNTAVLYYRANPRAPLPFSDTYTSGTGIYTREDNADITGGAFSTPSPGQVWEYPGGGKLHGLGQYGMPANPQNFNPNVTEAGRKGFTFVGALHNPSAYNSSNQTNIKPVKENSFVLISAGPDGLYGTLDDVVNYR